MRNRIIAAAVLASLGAGAAQAQTLDEVMVTARKFEENLQTTPVAVTAFSGEAIEAQSANHIGDAAKFIPNVSFAQASATSGGAMNAEIYIRGVGQSDFHIATDPGVGIYVDGVYFARSTGAVLDLLDLERLEVLRGPQGTLFGKNTIGGAFNFISKKPDPGELEGFAQVTTGRYNRLDIQGVLNAPLSDRVALRLSGLSKNRDGYTKRVVAGDTQGDEDALAGRLQLLVEASDRFTMELAVDGTRKRENTANTTLFFVTPTFVSCGARASDGAGGTPYVSCPTPAGPGEVDIPKANLLGLWAALTGSLPPSPNFPVPTRDDPFHTNATGSNVSNLDNWGVSGTLTWDLGAATLKSITAYRDLEARFGRDGDNGPTNYIDTQQLVTQDQLSQEFQLSGQALDGRLNWLVGAYYFTEDAVDDNVVKLASGLFPALEALPAALIPLTPTSVCPGPFPENICAGGAGNPINTGFDIDFFPYTAISTESYAAFSQVSWSLTERVGLTAGLRYTKEDKDFGVRQVRAQTGIRLIGSGGTQVPTPPGAPEVFLCVPATVCDPVWLNNSYDDWAPRFGIDFKASDNLFLYAVASKGFKSGGFNPRPTETGGVESFDPERLWSFEAGAKIDLFDRRARLNLAAFFNDYTDIQLGSVEANEFSQLIMAIRNAGKAEIYGFEAELSAMLGEGFRIDGSLGYLHDEFKEVPNTLPETAQLQKAPEWTASLGAQYERALIGGSSLVLRGDVAWRTDAFVDSNNTPQIAQDAYALVNARLAWTSADDRYELALFGTNLTDKRYIVTAASSIDSFGTMEGVTGRPREWGLSGRIRF